MEIAIIIFFFGAFLALGFLGCIIFIFWKFLKKKQSGANHFNSSNNYSNVHNSGNLNNFDNNHNAAYYYSGVSEAADSDGNGKNYANAGVEASLSGFSSESANSTDLSSGAGSYSDSSSFSSASSSSDSGSGSSSSD